MLVEYNIVRFVSSKHTFEPLRSTVVLEEVISAYINGSFYTYFHCLPTQIRELIVGHLLTEGIIENMENITDIEVLGKSVYVKLDSNISPVSRRQQLIAAFCSGSSIQQYLSEKARRLRFNKAKFLAEAILKSIDTLNLLSSTYRASRGSHSAILTDGNCNVILFSEDVSRHNAIDKVVGDASLRGVDLTRLFLAFTGRLTSEMVVKAAQVGIPVLVSLAAPTSLGISIAEDLGLTLVGLVERRYFNIYTLPERIEGAEERRNIKVHTPKS